MMKNLLQSAAMATLGAALLFPASPLQAQEAEGAYVEKGTWTFEVFGGIYDPDGDFDEDATFGFRVGRMVTDKVHLEGSLGYWNSEDDFSEDQYTGELEIEAVFVECTVGRLFRTNRRFSPRIFGGLGWAFGSADGTITGPGGTLSFKDYEDDSLVIHAGFGSTIHLTDKVYLRPQTRLRWYEARNTSDLDKELTLGLGFKF